MIAAGKAALQVQWPFLLSVYIWIYFSLDTKAEGRQIDRPRVTRDDIPAIFLQHYPEFVSGNTHSDERRIYGIGVGIIREYVRSGVRNPQNPM